MKIVSSGKSFDQIRNELIRQGFSSIQADTTARVIILGQKRSEEFDRRRQQMYPRFSRNQLQTAGVI